MEHFILWIIVGLLAGVLAKTVVPGNTPSGLIRDMSTGMFGALAGGWLYQIMLNRYSFGWIDSTMVAFIVAIGVLSLARLLRRTLA